MGFRRSLALVFVCLLGVSESATAQYDCEVGIRRLLAEALQVNPDRLTEITREYGAGPFAGVAFYRAQTAQGLHTRRMAAAVAVTGRDSIVVRGLADVAKVWQRTLPEELPQPSLASAAVRELLFQTGLLQRSDRVIKSASEVSAAYRTFLAPGSDLSVIRDPEEKVVDGKVRISFFIQASEGIVHYSAVVSQRGLLDLSRELIAHLQMN